MSQYWTKTVEGRDVLYGFDRPTGGYFFTEFFKDEEIGDEESDVVITISALTLSQLTKELFERYHFASGDAESSLKNDFLNDPKLTFFQIDLQKNLFGVDIMAVLQPVTNDLVENHGLNLGYTNE